VLPPVPDVPDVPPVVAVPELVFGLTPPVVGPLLAPLVELPGSELLVEEAAEDPPVAVVEELVVAVVAVDEAVL
jgi:hypothetical protein